MPTPQNMGLAEHFQHPLIKNLTKKSIDIYQTLLEVAYVMCDRRGYKAIPNQVTFFCPLEIVAFALNVNPCTIYRKLPELRESGLIDQRGHKTSHNGRTRSDGSLWVVNLSPEQGHKAKLHYEDLNQQYRNLSSDIKQGRTAYQFMQESNKGLKTLQGSELIISWILEPLTPKSQSKSSLSMTLALGEPADVEAVLDLPEIRKHERNGAVSYAALQCALYLGDVENIAFYRWLLWQAIRLNFQGMDSFGVLHTLLLQVKHDRRQVRKPGAVFVSRLKASSWWEPLRETAPLRVGRAPEHVKAR